MFILTKLVFRPYLALLNERKENIDGAIENAERVNGEADTKLESYEQQISQAKKQAALQRAELRSVGETEATSMLAEARSKAENRLVEARQSMEKSVQVAQLSLRTRADQIAKTVAQKLLGREV